LKGGSGGGKTLGVSAAAGRGSAVKAIADAAMMEVEPSNRRRLISIWPARDAALDSLDSELPQIVNYSFVSGIRATA
jgi:hypothetical protein